MLTIEQLIRRSHRATCGAFEREVVVKSVNAPRAIAMIKKSGLMIIGSGSAGFGRTKIWFISRGLAGL